ncbi:MAG: sulfate adenylyltransferase subunit CysN [Planctomycetes bacterium]|nr:sulfate adenylyltransferase subunit CysN [Planctomycetota bacterium]
MRAAVGGDADDLSAIGIESWLERYGRKELLRILTCGSVDDGKSTLIGRLLHDGAGVFDDQLAALKKDTARFGTTGEDIDFALLLDGLQAEREQGITIDVAYRYFATAKRKFIVADTPGHEQYTRNMATGASNADLAIILIDATKGVLPQTRRHAFICSLLGIRHVIVAINKMDLVGYDERVFDTIRAACGEFFAKLATADVSFVPLCARKGENVVHASANMPWYRGGPLLDRLENVYIASDQNLVDLRLPVQLVLRPNADYRGYAGTLASGVLRVGDEVAVLPSGKRSRVKALTSAGVTRQEVFAPMAVALTLEDEIDASRGDVFVRPNNAPVLEHALEAMVVWMSEAPLSPGRAYLLKTAALTTPATVTELRYKLNTETLRSEPAESLALNAIGRVRLECVRPAPVDAYSKNRRTGAFILIDRLTNATVAAGMVVERAPVEDALEGRRRAHDAGSNVRAHASLITPAERASRTGQTPFVVWFTGLPRSGKSTLAYALEKVLFERGRHALVLDGETLRRGLSADLGFSSADRAEQARRTAELARLFAEQGLIAIVASVSPTAEMRATARALTHADRFLEVFCDAPLEVCEARDKDRLFERARAGELVNVSGIDQAYEKPLNPDLRLDTARVDSATNLKHLLAALVARGWAPG